MAKPNIAREETIALDEIDETDLATSRVIGRGLRKHRKLPLRAIREAAGKTQIEIADAASMNQGDVSKLEQREDFKLSTLQRYVRALGGEIEITIVLPRGKRIPLDV